jgi:hypothetical protein
LELLEKYFDAVRENAMFGTPLESASSMFDDFAIMIPGRIESFETNPLESKYNEQENPTLQLFRRAEVPSRVDGTVPL